MPHGVCATFGRTADTVVRPRPPLRAHLLMTFSLICSSGWSSDQPADMSKYTRIPTPLPCERLIFCHLLPPWARRVESLNLRKVAEANLSGGRNVRLDMLDTMSPPRHPHIDTIARPYEVTDVAKSCLFGFSLRVATVREAIASTNRPGRDCI